MINRRGGINKTPNKKYFMLRRCLGSKKLEYTLNTNQGTPDVYVNGVYKGTVSNGVCKWKDSEYKTDVTITLQNCTAGNTYQSSQNADAWISVDGGTLYYDTQFKKITYTEEGSHTVQALWGTAYYNNIQSINSTGTLKAGNTSLTMNYNVSSSYLRFEQRSDSLPVTWKYSGEDQSSNHWNKKLCTFSSSGDTLYFTIDNNTGETWASGSYGAYAVPNETGLHTAYVDVILRNIRNY